MRRWEDASAGDCLRGEAVSLVFLKCPHLEDFFFHPVEARLRFCPDEILQLSRNYSSGEKILIRVALDIWSRSGDAKISQILDILDKENLFNVLSGLHFLNDQFK